jgi:hypothetical protein
VLYASLHLMKHALRTSSVRGRARIDANKFANAHFAFAKMHCLTNGL